MAKYDTFFCLSFFFCVGDSILLLLMAEILYVKTLQIMGEATYQLVQDFFHQQ